MKQVLVRILDESERNFIVQCQDDKSDVWDRVIEHFIADPDERDYLHSFALDEPSALFSRFLKDGSGHLFTSQYRPIFRPDLQKRFAGNAIKLQQYTRDCVRRNVREFFADRLDYTATYLRDAEAFLEDVFQGDSAIHIADVSWQNDMYHYAWAQLVKTDPDYIWIGFSDL